MSWQRPSEPITELIRRGAELVLQIPEQLIEELDAATLAISPAGISDDPLLAAAVRRNNRANLRHWAQSNVTSPGEPVAPNLGAESMSLARDIVRRGLDDTALEPYRVGTNVAWRRWMEIVFTLSSDPEELRQVLDVSSQSIFAFVDATMAGIIEHIRHERDELTRGTHAARMQAVTLILDGAPITRERAATLLGYDLDQLHTAAIVWSDQTEPEQGVLELAAEALARVCGSRRPLTVAASTAALWAWIPGSVSPDLAELEASIAQLPGVRVAVGTRSAGAAGFRRSHLDAIATQRLLMRVSASLRVADYDSVELVTLITHDEERSADFVRRTLGDLETAPPELRQTLRTYLGSGSNMTLTAEQLYTHRNTVLGRVGRARQLLPRPLAQNPLAVAVALEVDHWRGSNS